MMKKNVLITGALGGIGNATSKIFKENGWYVIGVDRIYDGQNQFIDLFINEDISKSDSVDHIFEKVCAHCDRINALVNNAGFQVAKSIIETSDEEWDEVFDSNIKSVFRAIKHAYPLLVKGQGSIVNISSVHAFATSKNISAYAASKGAMLAFTRSLALEFAEEGIRANAVIPGAVRTNMLISGLSRGHLGGERVDVLVDKLGLRHPINRVGEPDEIGKLIYFLADNNQSAFITGQSFVADGGALAQLSTEVS
jgi:NAD(P)-dependent dehydrogenase (short-subunit alcohol dehydrogenase family)